jgi:hypothetical protein
MSAPVCLALAYFLAAVAAHAILARLDMPQNIVSRFLLAGIASGLMLIWHSIRIAGLGVSSLAGIALYAFLCELYIFLFTFVISSVSARILFSMLSGPLSAGDLEISYDASGMVAQRLTRLKETGLLRDFDGALRLTQKGRRLHRAFLALKRFFGHG